jgi:predicted nucleic acid-binding protein
MRCMSGEAQHRQQHPRLRPRHRGWRRHEEAVALITRATLSDCVLTLQGLAELFNVTTRKGKLPPADAAAAVHRMAAVFEIHAADAATLPAATDAVVRHHLPFWDAMLWATVQQAGCSLLLTEDFQDRRKLGTVTFINPFDPANADLLDRALAPGTA